MNIQVTMMVEVKEASATRMTHVSDSITSIGNSTARKTIIQYIFVLSYREN